MTGFMPLASSLPQGADYVRILPEIVLSLFGIVVMLLDPLLDEESSQKVLGIDRPGGNARRDCGDVVDVANAGPGFLEYGAGRWLQRVLPCAGDRHRCRRHPDFVRIHGRCSGSARASITG